MRQDGSALVALAGNKSFRQLGGSCERFAESVAMACLERGLWGLAGSVLTLVSTFGEVCFLKYREIAGAITMPSGRHPHVRSVARVMRWAARCGYVDHRRIGPGRRPHKAKFFSPHGTTENRILPNRLGVKRIAKSLRSHLRCRAVEVLAPVVVVGAALASSSVDHASRPSSRLSALPAELVTLAEQASQRRRALAPPPSRAELERRALQQRRGLADLERQWAQEDARARAGPDPPPK